MKTSFIVLLVVFTVALSAQNSFVITRQSNSLTVSANATIDVVTTPTDVLTVTMDIQNTSTSTNVYNAKRYDMYLHKSSIDTALAYFCLGGCCYDASALTGFCTLTLSPNQNTATMGDFYSLNCDLKEASTIGYSVVKYTFFNVNQANDSLQFTIRYNLQLMGVSIKKESISTQALHVLPHPVKDQAELSLIATVPQDAQLILYNSIGDKMFQQSVHLTAGKNSVPLNMSAFPKGVYFLQLNSSNGQLTRKIIVE